MSGLSDALFSKKPKEASNCFLTTETQVDKIVESTKIILVQRRHIDHSILERQEDITTNLIIELAVTVQRNPDNNEQENPLLQQAFPPNKR